MLLCRARWEDTVEAVRVVSDPFSRWYVLRSCTALTGVYQITALPPRLPSSCKPPGDKFFFFLKENRKVDRLANRNHITEWNGAMCGVKAARLTSRPLARPLTPARARVPHSFPNTLACGHFSDPLWLRPTCCRETTERVGKEKQR